MKAKLDLDIDEYGKAMPTLRSKDVFDDLRVQFGGDEQLLKAYPKEYMGFLQRSMFDPRKSNVVYRTKAQALRAARYAAKLNELDEAYLYSKRRAV